MLGAMVEMTKYEHGVFNWVDLSAKDMTAAAAWYGELFGWAMQSQDTQGGPPYAMLTLGGKSVAGMGELSTEMQTAGVPPVWNTYVAVDDAAAVAAKVTEHGGTVVLPVMQVMGAGSMAIFADPEGAVFCVWQADAHIGAERVNEPNTFSWTELMTRDIEAAQAFYGNVFGWTFKTSDVGGTPYHLIHVGDREVGGMLQMDGPQFEGMRSMFTAYFTVADITAAVETVTKTGGTVMVPPTKIPVGTFAVVADPQGASFTLFQSA